MKIGRSYSGAIFFTWGVDCQPKKKQEIGYKKNISNSGGPGATLLIISLKLDTHYPCSRVVFTAREHDPWTRVVCTELKICRKNLP